MVVDKDVLKYWLALTRTKAAGKAGLSKTCFLVFEPENLFRETTRALDTLSPEAASIVRALTTGSGLTEIGRIEAAGAIVFTFNDLRYPAALRR